MLHFDAAGWEKGHTEGFTEGFVAGERSERNENNLLHRYEMGE